MRDIEALRGPGSQGGTTVRRAGTCSSEDGAGASARTEGWGSGKWIKGMGKLAMDHDFRRVAKLIRSRRLVAHRLALVPGLSRDGMQGAEEDVQRFVERRGFYQELCAQRRPGCSGFGADKGGSHDQNKVKIEHICSPCIIYPLRLAQGFEAMRGECVQCIGAQLPW